MSQVAIVCGLLLILSRGPWTDCRGLLSFLLGVSQNAMGHERQEKGWGNSPSDLKTKYLTKSSDTLTQFLFIIAKRW
jgi:hypothetical protein